MNGKNTINLCVTCTTGGSHNYNYLKKYVYICIVLKSLIVVDMC